MKAHKGFTLIELIIVIVVLGILAVSAAPQFINFSGDAREATLDGLKGAMNGAARSVYAKAAIQGEEDSSSYVTVSGVETVYGYPTALAAGITAALQIETADWDIAYTDNSDPGSTANTARFSPAGINDSITTTDHTTITECYVEYIDVTTAGNFPAISVVTTGC
ncbi:hypothetical protein IDSA_00110 [Pseudidiomarina salinarum]|uniref:MSHA biogenesis protein MshA n=1 Tax=Pseudidiomarina salinarum TaxID=435908 RepID=A0A094L8M2_9GAMM|nr:type II secretion system protein [Pseudidiomarina salinarum]KFZ31178.1 hypothetical protein IDSA_00110 [Pseudidiomarina salinarum]RUO71074.1 prepilin-type cleavage/methylation domain-containing protein [Pseudidiomarina salinarum]